MFRRHKKENKAKLEHKLYLARENPEPVFDLSECDINNVPSGIYSLCRVFLKESLNLSANNLNSLSGGGSLRDLHQLKILNLSNNAFARLPDDIACLSSLIELNLSHNLLKTLPSAICNLHKLKTLDLSNNLLKILPENTGDLKCLQSLNIEGNKDLKSLPKSLCQAQKLQLIELDGSNFVYPSSEVATQGTEEIMQYICKDTGVDYVSPKDVVDSIESSPSLESPNLEKVDLFQAKMWELERKKEQKVQEFLEIERINELQQQQELELANAQKASRRQLLSDITQQQYKFDQDLAKLHQERDLDRFRLIEQLQTTELNAELAIKELLMLNSQPLAQLLAHEAEEEQRLLAAANKYNENLRKDDILVAMQDLLENEYRKFREFDEDRVRNAENALKHEVLCDTKIAEILKYKDREQFELMAQLQEDSELQKFAVAALLERGDARSWGLVQQVKLVENQLAALTLIEIDRKKLKMDDHINDLAENRVNLSILLMDLLDQQSTRRAQLLSTLQSLEDSSFTSDDFWLKQYQRLLDQMPSGISEAQQNIPIQLAEALLLAGVIHCLPFLVKFTQKDDELLNITDEDLRTAGVTNSDDRRHILDAIKTYKKLQTTNVATSCQSELPSAPSVDSNTTYSTSECVICMDNNCQVIFLPCGHYCTCTNCSSTLLECPMCRADIERKIRVVIP